MITNESWQPQRYFIISTNYTLDLTYQKQIMHILKNSGLYNEDQQSMFSEEMEFQQALYYAGLDFVQIPGENPNVFFLQSIHSSTFLLLPDLLSLLNKLESYNGLKGEAVYLDLGTPALERTGMDITRYCFWMSKDTVSRQRMCLSAADSVENIKLP